MLRLPWAGDPMSAERYRLELEVTGAEPVVGLRRLLKRLVREYGFRCVGIARVRQRDRGATRSAQGADGGDSGTGRRGSSSGGA